MNKFIILGIVGIGLLAFGFYSFNKSNHISTPNPEISKSNSSNIEPVASGTQVPAKTQIPTTTPTPAQTNAPVVHNSSSDEPPLLLKSIGINLDYYDPGTNRAGDFLFTKQNLHFKRLLMPYGFFIPSSSASPDKYNPQPTFILPLGTPVRSLVDGVVASMPTLWSGDYSIHVTTNGKLEKWIYEVEHVINPTVKVGDKVKAGQIVGEVSTFDQGVPAGFGAVEIGILKGGSTPQHVCPFAYLDPSIKQEMEKKIIAFYKSWEDYVGDQTLYDELSGTPGCLTMDPIDG
ncbi:MAG: M23 family metallopeptidase [bacterium]|nr:M23 family metallopeptidase [bacterium]